MKRGKWEKGAALAALLLAGALLTAMTEAPAFTDIGGRPEQLDIVYAAERGLFSGTGEGRFDPDLPFDRGMAAAVFAKEARASGSARQAAKTFGDVDSGDYFAAAADFLWKYEIAPEAWRREAGEKQTFEADEPVTAGELAEMAENYLAWLSREGGPDFTPAEAKKTRAVSRSSAAVVFARLDRFLSGQKSELLTHTAQDGVELTGKLSLPVSGEVSKVVLFLNGTGPNTYDNRREYNGAPFNYYDLFADQLTARGIGFFRWNTRGVYPDDDAPGWLRIDDAVYRTYLPENCIRDVHEWIGELCARPELADAEVYLLGFSEGSIIAANAASRWPEEIDGLFLAGCCSETIPEILDRQLAQIEPAALRETARKTVYAAIESDDGAWIEENYGVKLTQAWFKGHGQLRANRELLPELSLPVEIFHGTADKTCSVEGVYEIRRSFEEKGKSNLQTHIYSGYGHEMKYSSYLKTGVMPQAFVDLFQRIGEIDGGGV